MSTHVVYCCVPCFACSVWDGTACVSECPCVFNDTQYDDGERWLVDECRVCECVDGVERCQRYCELNATVRDVIVRSYSQLP